MKCDDVRLNKTLTFNETTQYNTAAAEYVGAWQC